MGSTQLNEQELRNCIYQGAFTRLLEDLVLDGYMLLAMHADAPHKRYASVATRPVMGSARSSLSHFLPPAGGATALGGSCPVLRLPSPDVAGARWRAGCATASCCCVSLRCAPAASTASSCPSRRGSTSRCASEPPLTPLHPLLGQSGSVRALLRDNLDQAKSDNRKHPQAALSWAWVCNFACFMCAELRPKRSGALSHAPFLDDGPPLLPQHALLLHGTLRCTPSPQRIILSLEG